jgi:poly(A) polymerase
MVRRRILEPVLPEIVPGAVESLRRLVAAETSSGLSGEPLRRLAALLPPDCDLAERVAARLKLSVRARKRVACAASRDIGPDPRALAYRIGTQCAADRLLLAGRAEESAAIARWTPPKLPIGGGALITLGVPRGPEVARTLRRVEERWLAAGFPDGEEFERIVADVVAGHR